MLLNVQILGSGCKNCQLLFTRTQEILQELGKEASVEKIEDMARIMSFGVMVTPALVVDGKLAFSGFVPSKEQIRKYLLQVGS